VNNSANVFSPAVRKIFIVSILLFFIPKLLNTYFLMPFPGSMNIETMRLSYFLDSRVNLFLYACGLIVIAGSLMLIYKGQPAKKTGGIFLLLLSIAFFYFTVFKMNAKEMFMEPSRVTFKNAELKDLNPSAYILGVTDGNEAKAYPLKYLAYHHKIIDTLNGKIIMATYCSMCRSARVYSPVVDGSLVTFRLVGARHYNAVIEDSKTGSWWYQETGVAAAGPMKGKSLETFPSEQTTWKNWILKHPESLLLQPDPSSLEKYEDWFADFDSARSPIDTIPVNNKMWVSCLSLDGQDIAYPFPLLVKKQLINDVAGKTAFVITIESDSLTTHAWKSTVGNSTLEFIASPGNTIQDVQSHSIWNMTGLCVEGLYKGNQLTGIQHYNEYWRSWKQFHPDTSLRQ
jgi:hypothetical protein